MPVVAGGDGVKPKIICEDLCKVFPLQYNQAVTVLDKVSLAVAENEFVVVLGPGRCGKTTLLRIVAGLEMPSAGRVLLDGAEVRGPHPRMGMVFQGIALFPWKTVLENVEMGPRLRGVDRRVRRQLAEHLIRLVGLEGFEGAYPHQLSGGMKQRVGIARAYCNDPEVLLMDEPFGHLDAQTRYQMEEELLRVWEAEKRTVLFVTNNIEEATYLADRILVLSACPARVRAEYRVALPRPRSYTDPRFLELRREIAAQMDLVL
jgi:NitT/TauT family transport system ATP-binding protein/sulfonate transport system ATP-binding protein